MTPLRRAAAVATTAALAFAATATAASAADRYIATTGADSGDCTDSAAPCLTWRFAQNAAANGDTVHFAAGTYGTANFPTAFSVSKSLTIQGPQAGVPAPGRTGPEAIISQRLGGNVISTSASSNEVTIDGLSLSASAQTAVNVANARTTIANTRIDGTGSLAVRAWGTVGTDVHGSMIGDGFETSILGVTDLTLTQNVLATHVQSDTHLSATSNTFLGAEALFVHGSGVEAHGNRFAGSSAIQATLEGGGVVDAADNWFGCNGGANTSGCASVEVFEGDPAIVAPHLVLAGSVSPATVAPDGTADVDATLLRSSDGSADPYALPPASDVSYATNLGTLDATSLPLGETNALAVGSVIADGTVGITLDNQTVDATFKVRVPGLTVDPTDSDFGAIAVDGTSGTRTFTVSNGSGNPIRIRSVDLAGADPDQFTLWANACRTTLADGASCQVSAAFKPISSGAKEATISIIADGLRSPVSIPLTGTANADDDLSITPGSADFGLVSAGGASPRQNMTLQNTGSGPMAITSITTAGADFDVSAGACRTTLPSGGSCVLSASFRPTTSGVRSAVVSVRATGQPTRTVTLTGTGVGSALSISPASAAFGAVRVGSSTKQLLTVTNNGQTAAPVTLGSVTLAGAAAGSYVLYGGGCAKQTLPIGASCQFSVVLHPTSAGMKSAQITLAATGQPARTIDLTGTAS